MTIGLETINGNTYLVTRDDQGNIIEMIGRTMITPPPIISRYAYRALFTLAEKIAIETVGSNANLTALQKVTLAAIVNDFREACFENVNLSHPAVVAFTNLLETLGLIAAGRAAQILANQPHP